MKNIIVPTDFSKNAMHALEHAIAIANQFGSTIHLVHGNDMLAATGIYTDVNNMLQESAMIRLKEIIGNVSKQLDEMCLIRPKVLKGSTAASICDYAEGVDGELIVMGTQGATGLKTVFVGTIALGVVKEAKCPVLVVPENDRPAQFRKFALAVDDEKLGKQDIFSPLRKMVSTFKAKLIVYHFHKAYAMAGVDPNIEHFLEGIDYTFFDQYSEEKDTKKAIDNFVKAEAIDLLVMVRRKRNFVAQIFHKSVTSREVFNSEVPLLVLQE